MKIDVIIDLDKTFYPMTEENMYAKYKAIWKEKVNNS